GETKGYGVSIIVGESTALSAPGFALLEIGGIRVRGRAGESKVFALLGDAEKARSAEFVALRTINERYLRCVAAGDKSGALAAIADARAEKTFALSALWDRREAETRALPAASPQPSAPEIGRAAE